MTGKDLMKYILENNLEDYEFQLNADDPVEPEKMEADPDEETVTFIQ